MPDGPEIIGTYSKNIEDARNRMEDGHLGFVFHTPDYSLFINNADGVLHLAAPFNACVVPTSLAQAEVDVRLLGTTSLSRRSNRIRMRRHLIPAARGICKLHRNAAGLDRPAYRSILSGGRVMKRGSKKVASPKMVDARTDKAFYAVSRRPTPSGHRQYQQNL